MLSRPFRRGGGDRGASMIAALAATMVVLGFGAVTLQLVEDDLRHADRRLDRGRTEPPCRVCGERGREPGDGRAGRHVHGERNRRRRRLRVHDHQQRRRDLDDRGPIRRRSRGAHRDRRAAPHRDQRCRARRRALRGVGVRVVRHRVGARWRHRRPDRLRRPGPVLVQPLDRDAPGLCVDVRELPQPAGEHLLRPARSPDRIEPPGLPRQRHLPADRSRHAQRRVRLQQQRTDAATLGDDRHQRAGGDPRR